MICDTILNSTWIIKRLYMENIINKDMTIKERIERQRKLGELINKYDCVDTYWSKVAIADLIVAELKKK